MATITGSKRLLDISANAMAASNSMTYGGLNVATEQYVSTQIANLVSSAPGALDTLNELAAALGDDPNFATTMTNALAGKLSTGHDMTLTLNGDASGSATFTNMSNATLTVVVANDSHTHDGRYYTETEVNNLLSGKLSTSGKAADSNLLDGLDLGGTRANVANKVVRTDGNGYTNFGWINTTSGNTTSTLTDIYVNTNDGYIRKATPAHFRSQITDSHYDSAGSAAAVETALNTRIEQEVLPAIPTNNNQLTNGAGYITDGNTGWNNSYGFITSTVTSSLTIAGSETRGTYTSLSQYHSGADNLVLKGNSVGISSIFFESEKDGTNINHPSDFGFIQYHAYGTSTSGESNELIIGVSNDADDHLVFNAPNTNGMKFRIGTSETDYTVYHSGNLSLATLGYTGATNANYITNNNQLTNGAGYITGVSWAGVTGKPSSFTPSAHTHGISDIDGLQGALDEKQPAGSYAASNHNHTYNVNDAWLRDNGDNANVKLYGNSRQMVFRTDGETEYASGVGAYAFVWMYGGDAAGNRRMLLDHDGGIWSSKYGWLDSAFAAASHNHAGVYDPVGTGAAAADTVNTRINEEVLPAIATKADAGHDHSGVYLPVAGKAADSEKVDGINGASLLRSDADDSFSGALTSTSRDKGIFGTYDSTKTDHIWSMGTAYKNSSTGANFGNLYGIAYKHTNNTTGGTMAGGHQAVFVNNGTPGTAISFSGGVWTSNHGDSGNWKQAYDNYITGIAVSGTATKTITLTQRDGGTLTASFTDSAGSGGDGYLSGLSFNTGTGVLTGTVTGGTNVTVDLDGRYESAGSAATVNDRIDTEVLPAIGAVTLASLGYTGATNANYITNNNQLTNGAGYLTSSNDRNYITDSRGAQRAPSYYNDRYAQWDFQNVSDTGVGGDGWHALLTVSKWSSFDPSHRQEQLIFSGDHLWRRTAVSDANWGDNKKIWDSGNLDPVVDASVSNDTITFTKAGGGTFAVTTSDANTWRPIDDTPVNGVTDQSISSNWAYDHVNASNPHGTTASDVGADAAGSANAVNSRIDTEVLPAISSITLASLGYTGATNANYITNNSQLTNGAGYITGVSDFGATGTYSELFINSGLVPGTNLPQDIRPDYWMNANGSWMLFSYTALLNKPSLGTAAAAATTDFAAASHTHTPAQVGLGNLSSDGNALAGNFTATGDITAFSDIRVKENIKDLEGSLDKVTQLRGVSYNKIGSEEKSIGVIAQEIKEVLPEVVKESEDGMLSVAYGNITAVLIEAIKEQQKQIEQLKAQLDGLTK